MSLAFGLQSRLISAAMGFDQKRSLHHLREGPSPERCSLPRPSGDAPLSEPRRSRFRHFVFFHLKACHEAPTHTLQVEGIWTPSQRCGHGDICAGVEEMACMVAILGLQQGHQGSSPGMSRSMDFTNKRFSIQHGALKRSTRRLPLNPRGCFSHIQRFRGRSGHQCPRESAVTHASGALAVMPLLSATTDSRTREHKDSSTLSVALSELDGARGGALTSDAIPDEASDQLMIGSNPRIPANRLTALCSGRWQLW